MLDARAWLHHSSPSMKANLTLLAAVAALIWCGCSRFNHEWRQAAHQRTPTNDITGRWEGHWQSHVNGHHNKLRCLITKVDESNYNAKFYADYKKWLTVHFGYTVRLKTAADTNGVTFKGAEDLGWLAGGLYTYVGQADPTNFSSTYDSKYDRGTFQMKRPVAEGTIPVYSSPERR